ncbi:MAG: hypothetical protein CMJ48_09045 [Planctomycetaceae bacterium]|nr:hypothetical protein [Planctomycetaceae bacterium]
MTSARITLALFLIGLFIAIILLVNARVDDMPHFEIGILWLRQAIGTFVATVAALMILLRALDDRPIRDVMTLVVAFLAGSLIVAVDWSLAVPLGLIIVALVVNEIVQMVRTQREDDRR